MKCEHLYKLDNIYYCCLDGNVNEKCYNNITIKNCKIYNEYDELKQYDEGELSY
jgi:hypothetical protein